MCVLYIYICVCTSKSTSIYIYRYVCVYMYRSICDDYDLGSSKQHLAYATSVFVFNRPTMIHCSIYRLYEKQ